MARKRFEKGEVVEVQRRVGGPWTTATYDKPMVDWRAHHRVNVDPHHVDAMTGNDTTAENPRGYVSTLDIVPSRRIRKPGARP